MIIAIRGMLPLAAAVVFSATVVVASHTAGGQATPARTYSIPIDIDYKNNFEQHN
jgi:hypothetical protein